MTYQTYVTVQAIKWLAVALVLSPPLSLPIAFTLLYGQAHVADDSLSGYNFALWWIGIIWDAPTFYFLHCARKGYFRRDWQKREGLARGASRKEYVLGAWRTDDQMEDEN